MREVGRRRRGAPVLYMAGIAQQRGRGSSGAGVARGDVRLVSYGARSERVGIGTRTAVVTAGTAGQLGGVDKPGAATGLEVTGAGDGEAG